MSTVTVTTTPTILDAGTAFDLSLVNSGSLSIHVEISGGSLGLLYHEILRPNQQVTVYPHGYPVSAFTDSGTSSVDVTLGDNPQLNASREAAQDALAAGALVKTANLSDVANAATARTNLGLGTAATHPDTDFLTPSVASATYAPYGVTNARNPLTGWYHINQYGAVADSDGTTGVGTDNGTAIRAAITAAQSAGRGRVYVPIGTYRATGQVRIAASNIALVGAGPGLSTLFFDDTSDYPHLMVSNGVYPAGGVSAVWPTSALSNVTVRDLTLQGLYSTAPALNGSLLFMWAVKNGLVENVEVSNSNGMGIIVLGNNADLTMPTREVIVQGNHVHNCRLDGIHVSENATTVQVIKNVIHDTDDDGIGIGYDAGANDHILVADNMIYNGGSRGIAVMGPTSNAIVRDNTIYDTWLNGIYVECTQGDVTNVDIRGNTIWNAGMGTSANPRGVGYACGIFVHTASGSYGIYSGSITGNKIFTPRNSFIAVGSQFSGSGSPGGAVNIQILDNHLVGIAAVGGAGAATGNEGGSSSAPVVTKYPGIWVRESRNAIVSGNFISLAYQEAVRCDNDNDRVTTITDNQADDCNQSNTASTSAFTQTNGKAFVATNMIRDPSSHLAGTVDLTGATSLLNVNNVLTT